MNSKGKYLNWLLLVLNVLLFQQLRSQNHIDLLKLTGAATPPNQFDSSNVSSTIYEAMADITLPIKVNDKVAIITGTTLEYLNAKLSPELNHSNTVYTTLLKAGVNISHGEHWSSTWVLMPKLSSDFDQIDYRDFQLGGSALFKFKKNAIITYQFGAYYNQELSGPFLVPLLGLYYKSVNNRFEINATLPVWAEMSYSLNDWCAMGINFLAFVKTFHFTDSDLSSNAMYWAKATNEIFAYTQFSLKKNYLFQIKYGYSIAREYAVYDENDKVNFAFSAFKFGDNRTLLNQYFSDGPIIQARFIYRFFL